MLCNLLTPLTVPSGALTLVSNLAVRFLLLSAFSVLTGCDRGRRPQDEGLAMLLRLASTDLDTHHLIWRDQAHHRQLLPRPDQRCQDQPKRLANLDMRRWQPQPKLVRHLSLKNRTFAVAMDFLRDPDIRLTRTLVTQY